MTQEQRSRKTELTRQWRINNPARWTELHGRAWKKMKMEVLNAYGRVCACCGESSVEFLAIDHINGDGNKHRKEVVGGRSGIFFYRWLQKENFPKGFQVLCHNCNMATRFGRTCPHKQHQLKVVA